MTSEERLAEQLAPIEALGLLAPRDEEFKKQLAMYLSWLEACMGWHPFKTIACRHCGKPLRLLDIFRCFECNAPFHKECLIAHCKEKDLAFQGRHFYMND